MFTVINLHLARGRKWDWKSIRFMLHLEDSTKIYFFSFLNFWHLSNWYKNFRLCGIQCIFHCNFGKAHIWALTWTALIQSLPWNQSSPICISYIILLFAPNCPDRYFSASPSNIKVSLSFIRIPKNIHDK